MIKVSVMYPYEQGANFDMNYYIGTHMPMVRRLFGDVLKGQAVDQGFGGAAPGTPAPYAAIGHLVFDSVAAFYEIMAQHGAAIVSDIKNYSTVQPVIQISEMKLG